MTTPGARGRRGQHGVAEAHGVGVAVVVGDGDGSPVLGVDAGLPCAPVIVSWSTNVFARQQPPRGRPEVLT